MTTTATFAALAATVRQRPARLGRTRLVCVDGPAGSGKTTFAAGLLAALGAGAQTVHMDDLYAGWTLTGARARLAAAVLRPLADGEPGGYPTYDWATGRFRAEPTPVGPAEVLVVEGCASCAPGFDPWTSLRIWVEAPVEVRLARGLARDGASLEPEWRRWQQREGVVFTAEATRDRADVRVDGAEPADGGYLPLASCQR